MKISLALAAFWLCILIMTKGAFAGVIAKGAFAGVIGLMGLSLPLFGQQISLPQPIKSDGFAIDNSALFHSATGLWDRRPFSFSGAFNWMEPTGPNFPPVVADAESKQVNVSAKSGGRISDRLMDALPKLDYATGEIGFLYGRSTGKFGGEFKQGYIIGEVGDDKFHISAGASYEDSSLRLPRFGR